MNEDFKVFNDSNIKYTGTSSTNVGVSQGESLSRTLENIVIALSSLIDKVNSCSFCEGGQESLSLSSSNISVNSNSTQNTTITSSKNLNVKTIPNSTGVGVTYNLDDVITSLGDSSTTTILRSKTTINGLKNGFPSTILDTSKTSGTLNLKPDNFPATLDTEIRYQDAQGEKTISLKVPLSSTTSELNLPLQGTLSGNPNINTQEDLNTHLQDRVLNLENNLSTLNSVNISGFNSNLPTNSNINQAIAYVLSEIENIKSQLP